MRFALLAALPDLSESGVDLTRYVFVCLLTIGLVLLGAWLLRRFVAQGLQRKAAQRSLAVMDVLPLGRKQRAVVLRCYDRSFLIGLGEREVSLLAELDPEAQPELESSPAATQVRPQVPKPSTAAPVPQASLAPARPAEPLTSLEPTPAPESRPALAPTSAPDNFAEALAAEVPVQAPKPQPGVRLPKEGFLG